MCTKFKFGKNRHNGITIDLKPVSNTVRITHSKIEFINDDSKENSDIYLEAIITILNDTKVYDESGKFEDLWIKSTILGIPVVFRPVTVEDYCLISEMGLISYKVRYKASFE